MGPLQVSKPWSTSGISGVHRFLDRVWRLFEREIVDTEPPEELIKLLHKTIKKVSHDTDSLQFNTAISQMMIFVNELFKQHLLHRALIEPFVLLLNPYAPHLAEELWERLGREPLAGNQEWPAWQEELTRDDQITLVFQINGKVRAQVEADSGITAEEMKEMALSHPRIRELTEGKQIRKVIPVPGKLVNIVAN
jgi:leucyl-tRNA synthetase